MRGLPGWLLTTVLLVPTSASAQHGRPPVEVGAGVAGLAAVPYEDFGLPENSTAALFRASVPFTPRFSVEGLMTVGRHEDRHRRATEGFYQIQVKQRIVRGTHGRFHPFVTYGAAGYYRSVRVAPFTEPSGARFPGFSYNEVDEPWAAVLGGGVQHVLNRRLAWRADAQLLTFLWVPLGGRFDTSLSIPIGRGYE